MERMESEFIRRVTLPQLSHALSRQPNFPRSTRRKEAGMRTKQAPRMSLPRERRSPNHRPRRSPRKRKPTKSLRAPLRMTRRKTHKNRCRVSRSPRLTAARRRIRPVMQRRARPRLVRLRRAVLRSRRRRSRRRDLGRAVGFLRRGRQKTMLVSQRRSGSRSSGADARETVAARSFHLISRSSVQLRIFIIFFYGLYCGLGVFLMCSMVCGGVGNCVMCIVASMVEKSSLHRGVVGIGE
jgi:hypothetical protein